LGESLAFIRRRPEDQKRVREREREEREEKKKKWFAARYEQNA